MPGAEWLVLGGWLVGGWLVAGGWSFVRTACLSRSELAMKARAGLRVVLWLQLLHAATVVASICHPTLDLFGHAPAPVPRLPLPLHIPPPFLHLSSTSLPGPEHTAWSDSSSVCLWPRQCALLLDTCLPNAASTHNGFISGISCSPSCSLIFLQESSCTNLQLH